MTNFVNSVEKQYYLGVETGATHTSVIKIDSLGIELLRLSYGPANLRLISDALLQELFEAIKDQAGDVSAIAMGIAGLRTRDDKSRVIRIARRVWPKTPFYAGSDMEIAVEAVGVWPEQVEARVILLSGTGSCAYGINRDGRNVRFGGRGHILGDQGSACDIALKALRAIVYQYDLNEEFPVLGQSMLRSLHLNHPDDLISWSQEAGKNDIAHLAITVFEEASKKDLLAQKLISDAAQSLADMALHCAGHLVEQGKKVQFLLTGGVLLNQLNFATMVSQCIHDSWEECLVEPLNRESVWGAVELARRLIMSNQFSQSALSMVPPVKFDGGVTLDSLVNSPTEQRNALSTHLDTMNLDDAIKLMVDENVIAVKSILQQHGNIRWLIERTIQAFQSGGRLFYAGAGTSGRLGILDASECPPTFCVSAEQVQGIIAGGQRAIGAAVEGAEDVYEDGASAVIHRGVRRGDIFLGIASSGRTPFVWGAMAEAKKKGAITCLLCFNPSIKVKAEDAPDRIIVIDAGPEVLTGSTRLKAGTATKVVLNTLTTLAMTHTGKVMSNLMVNLNASNDKLRERAIRLVCELTGCDKDTATAALIHNAWIVKSACMDIKESV